VARSQWSQRETLYNPTPMRLLVTADLHFNHPKSRALAEDLINEMNRAGGDVLLVVGDTAVAEGESLEQCLSRFRFSGPKLFVPGNHELWTTAGDSGAILRDVLPRRVRELGWHWLQGDPLRVGDVGFAGSVGWYDYAFAPHDLGIPRRFYERKVSPGAAERLSEHADLFDADVHGGDDVPPAAREVVARWNDAKFVRLGRSDEAFLAELLGELRAGLDALRDAPRVVAAIHHLPFRELLPPPRNPQWDFAKAFLGSPRLGELLLACPNVRDCFCGHSHFAAEATVGHVHAVNVGSGYRAKTFKTLEL
jgi:Icc-related predicted phosphoesterase